MITHERVKQAVNYDPDTGAMKWKTPSGNRVHVGSKFGTPDSHGYLAGQIDGTKYKIHRLAWLWFYGTLPDQEIDHINGRRDDNRIENLRLADRRDNTRNSKVARRHNKTSRRRGVVFKKNRWQAKIGIDGKSKHLGRFDTFDEAVAARERAETEFFGEFAPRD